MIKYDHERLGHDDEHLEHEDERLFSRQLCDVDESVDGVIAPLSALLPVCRRLTSAVLCPL